MHVEFKTLCDKSIFLRHLSTHYFFRELWLHVSVGIVVTSTWLSIRDLKTWFLISLISTSTIIGPNKTKLPFWSCVGLFLHMTSSIWWKAVTSTLKTRFRFQMFELNISTCPEYVLSDNCNVIHSTIFKLAKVHKIIYLLFMTYFQGGTI